MEKYGEESHGFAYDVFLSFRGEDTRDKFTGHLLKNLREKGINTFFDDKNLRIGDVLSPALLKAIEDSKILIIVFSENYATSKWCLAELEKIIECTERNNQQLAFPIFYHVDPSDVRNQKNSYDEAMTAHETRYPEKIQAWRSALSKAANLKGHHIKTGSEAKHIEEIVKKVSARKAPKPLHVGEDLVGLKHRIEEVKSLLDMKDDTISMLGIYGLGGVGKTELAKVLYNEIAHQFEAASFLANVREKSKKNGLEHLQKTLLSEMFERLKTELGSTYRGIFEMKKRLQKKKVLLVLDDVDESEQLNELAGRSDWFGPGSRIIITTRNTTLLDGHRFQKTYYRMTELNDQYSLELFCRNAFGKSHPETDYEDVSYRAVSYAKGLPLALKVIGSNLAPKKRLEDWEKAMEIYEKIPDKKIQGILKISYDSLEPSAQSVFLDIACFFKGERRDYVIKILDGDVAAFHIEELVNKSLVTVEHDCLKMHDLIEDMGRVIVMQEAKYPGKRSRLWDFEDVLEVLIEDSGSDAIEGIILDPPQRKVVEWSGIAFKKMISLRILVVRNTSFTSEPAYLPNYLRLLDWEGYPSKSFPPEFHPRKIIVLNLTNSQLTLEEPFKKFSYLAVMNFSYNVSITAMPDVSEVENLRELRLDNCKNLISVHESVGSRKYLAHLSASGCTKLTNFLQRMFLPSLEVLDLNVCVKLEHFPDIVSNMNKPLKISMMNTSIERLPDSIGNLTGLESLEMPNSWKLKYLPSSLLMLPNAVAFKFGGCSKLGESFRRFLHDSPSEANGRSTLKALHFGNSGLSDEDLHAILICFPELEELIASDNNFVSFPACIEESAHLTNLNVSGCYKLRKIHECSKLRFLNVDFCEVLEHISELPCTIQKVDARYCCSLSREASDMLWDQVKKERRGLEIVMPRTEIPEWFDYSCKGGNARFWAPGKFPIVAVALVFEGVIGRPRKSRRQLVELHLVINGKCVPRKGYYNFRIEGDHVLVCDLRLLFSEEEWLGLDAFLEHEWNQVQVSYEAPSTVTLSHWGVFVYKQETNMEDVRFMCPDPKYSDIATIPTIVRKRDPMKDQMTMIEELALDKMFDGMLDESLENEHLIPDREQFEDWMMTTVRGLSKEAQDALEGKALDDKNSPLAWILRTIKEDNDEDEAISTNFDHKDGMKPSTDVGEASTSGHQGSSEAQGSDLQKEDILMGIFLNGIGAGLREAQSSFPSLDIDTTMFDAFKKGNRVRLSLPESELETKIYMEGIFNGLLEAKLNFPTLDEGAILATVLRKEGLEVMFQALDWTKVTVPSSNDPLLEIFMMMKQESCESEANKSKLFCKLMEEHKALRKKFEEFENETSALEKDSCCLLPSSSSKNEYNELIEKLNTQFAELISKKDHSIDGTDDDAQAKESTLSDSKSALSSTNMHTDIGIEGRNGVARYDKLGDVLKGRAEELRRLYDAGIEGFQSSEEIQDLMSVIYLNGLRDGLLEAQAILLALDIDTSITPVFKEENEEHATHEVAIDEHVTAEAENPGEHVSVVAANNENPHETDIQTPPGLEVDNPRDTSNPSGSEVVVNMDDFGYMFS